MRTVSIFGAALAAVAVVNGDFHADEADSTDLWLTRFLSGNDTVTNNTGGGGNQQQQPNNNQPNNQQNNQTQQQGNQGNQQDNQGNQQTNNQQTNNQTQGNQGNQGNTVTVTTNEEAPVTTSGAVQGDVATVNALVQDLDPTANAVSANATTTAGQVVQEVKKRVASFGFSVGDARAASAIINHAATKTAVVVDIVTAIADKLCTSCRRRELEDIGAPVYRGANGEITVQGKGLTATGATLTAQYEVVVVASSSDDVTTLNNLGTNMADPTYVEAIATQVTTALQSGATKASIEAAFAASPDATALAALNFNDLIPALNATEMASSAAVSVIYEMSIIVTTTTAAPEVTVATTTSNGNTIAVSVLAIFACVLSRVM